MNKLIYENLRTFDKIKYFLLGLAVGISCVTLLFIGIMTAHWDEEEKLRNELRIYRRANWENRLRFENEYSKPSSKK